MVVRSGIRTHAHIRGPERSILRLRLCEERCEPWVWRLRPLGHPDCSVTWPRVRDLFKRDHIRKFQQLKTLFRWNVITVNKIDALQGVQDGGYKGRKVGVTRGGRSLGHPDCMHYTNFWKGGQINNSKIPFREKRNRYDMCLNLTCLNFDEWCNFDDKTLLTDAQSNAGKQLTANMFVVMPILWI